MNNNDGEGYDFRSLTRVMLAGPVLGDELVGQNFREPQICLIKTYWYKNSDIKNLILKTSIKKIPYCFYLNVPLLYVFILVFIRFYTFLWDFYTFLCVFIRFYAFLCVFIRFYAFLYVYKWPIFMRFYTFLSDFIQFLWDFEVPIFNQLGNECGFIPI